MLSCSPLCLVAWLPLTRTLSQDYYRWGLLNILCFVAQKVTLTYLHHALVPVTQVGISNFSHFSLTLIFYTSITQYDGLDFGP